MEVLDGLPAAALKLDVEVPKMSAEEEKKEDSSSKFVDCKMGAYLLDHVWDIERLDDIQPLEFLDDFVPVPQFFTMVDILNHELNAVLKRMKNGETGQRAHWQQLCKLSARWPAGHGEDYDRKRTERCVRPARQGRP